VRHDALAVGQGRQRAAYVQRDPHSHPRPFETRSMLSERSPRYCSPRHAFMREVGSEIREPIHYLLHHPEVGLIRRKSKSTSSRGSASVPEVSRMSRHYVGEPNLESPYIPRSSQDQLQIRSRSRSPQIRLPKEIFQTASAASQPARCRVACAFVFGAPSGTINRYIVNLTFYEYRSQKHL
jgi:hypothetical protein